MSMTETLVLAVALFAITAAATLALIAVAAPDPVVRDRARQLLLALARGRRDPR